MIAILSSDLVTDMIMLQVEVNRIRMMGATQKPLAMAVPMTETTGLGASFRQHPNMTIHSMGM